MYSNDAKLLAELVIEYHNNTNAAGEYDGNDPRFSWEKNGGYIDSEYLVMLAKKVLEEDA